MASKVYENSIDDTNNYEASDTRQQDEEKTLYHIVNTHDQDLAVDIAGTYYGDGNNSDTATIKSGITVAAGGGVEYETLTDSWDKIVFTITASTAPTGNGSIIIRKMKREVE